MIRLFIPALMMLFLFSACRKEEKEAVWETIATETTEDLHGLYFSDAQHGYACGGSLYDVGVWLQTTDGGKSWCCLDSVYIKCAYAVSFLNPSQGIISGFDGFIARTQNSGMDWDITNMPAWEPILDLHPVSLNSWVIAGGTSFDKGFLGYTTDGGQQWTIQRVDHRMESVQSFDGQYWVAGGFGAIYLSSDSGKNWTHSGQRGDFYMDVVAVDDRRAVAVGQQGSILYSDNRGQSWRRVKSGNHPFESPESFEAVHFYDTQHGMAVGMQGLMYLTTDGGQRWTKVKPFTDHRLRDVRMTDVQAAVVAGERGMIYRVQIP